MSLVKSLSLLPMAIFVQNVDHLSHTHSRIVVCTCKSQLPPNAMFCVKCCTPQPHSQQQGIRWIAVCTINECMMLLCTILDVHYVTVMLIQLNSMQCVLMCFVSFSPSQWWDIEQRGFEHISSLQFKAMQGNLDIFWARLSTKFLWALKNKINGNWLKIFPARA